MASNLSNPRVRRMLNLSYWQSEAQVPTDVFAAAGTSCQPGASWICTNGCDHSMTQLVLQSPGAVLHPNIPSHNAAIESRIYNHTLRCLIIRLHIHNGAIIVFTRKRIMDVSISYMLQSTTFVHTFGLVPVAASSLWNCDRYALSISCRPYHPQQGIAQHRMRPKRI